MRVCKAAALVMLASIVQSTSTYAAVLIEETRLVSRSLAYDLIAPEPKTLTIEAAGQYSVTLGDVGFPAALSSAELVIVRGVEVVLQMKSTGTRQFDATPGSYTVRVNGQGSSAGTLSVSIAPTGGAALLSYQSGIAANPNGANPDRSTVATTFSVAQAGNYQVTLTDRQFPVANASVDLLIVAKNGTPLARVCTPAMPPACSGNTASFAASIGEYDLFVNALAASSTHAGLYSVRVDGASAVYANTHAVGRLKEFSTLQLPSAGQYQQQVTDLQFPKALSAIRTAIAQKDSLVVASTGAIGQQFAAAAGPASLYVVGTAQSATDVGAFEVSVRQGAASIFDELRAVIGSTLADTSVSTARAFGYTVPVATSGQFRIQLSDFAFPSSIASLQLIAMQNGNRVASMNTAGTTTFQADAGPVVLLVVADMVSQASMGLFSVSVDSTAAGQSLLATTQGVGELFHSKTVNVVESKRLDVAASDLGFPSAFSDLALTVTRGHTLVGQIFGGGKFTFPATPGEYSLNFVARAGATQNYGLYGLKLEESPALPAITLIAAPSVIQPGATTTLSWSSTGATSCTASGGWAGAKETSSSATNVGPFSARTTFTLTCTGPGGTSSAATDVSIAETDNSSGGGTLGIEILSLIALLAVRRRRD